MFADQWTEPSPEYARLPCQSSTGWDPQQPLEVHWSWVDRVPEAGTRNFTDEAWLQDAKGNDVPFLAIRMGEDSLLICPLGGLAPDSWYTWQVGPFSNRHTTQLPADDPWEAGTWQFETAPGTDLPPLTRSRCEDLAAAGPTAAYEECHPESCPTYFTCHEDTGP